MGKFEQAGKVGLREKTSKKLLAVYPFEVKGSDEEIEKTVRDWYYKQSCQAEDQLLTAIVDTLTEQELKHSNGGK
jgi:hypothetical protein